MVTRSGADDILARRLAVRRIAVGARRSTPDRDREPLDGGSRAAWPRLRVPLRLCRYLHIPGAGVLPEARLSRIRPARLSARPPSDLLPKGPRHQCCQGLLVISRV